MREPPAVRPWTPTLRAARLGTHRARSACLGHAPALCYGVPDGGGVIEPDDAAALPLWLSAVTWWTERNVQIAISQPSGHHDQLATWLVDALARGVETVQHRQLFLNTVMAPF